jgi:hypothetical protein
MAKLGVRHGELAAYRAGHRFHATEYRSVGAAGYWPIYWPISADMTKEDQWARAAIKNWPRLGVARRRARLARLYLPAARALARDGFPERARCPWGRTCAE